MAMSPRLLRPTASGFNPRRIAGLQLWLDAADQSTLFDAGTGGSTVAANAAVGRWADKSGNGRNFTQDTGNNRPLYRAAGRNGRGTLEFDGSNDHLVGDATQYFRTDTPFTAIFVHLVASDSGSFGILMNSKTNQTQNVAILNEVSVSAYADYTLGSNANFANSRYTSAPRNVWRYMLFDFVGSSATTAASYSARTNKASLTQSSGGAFSSSTQAAATLGAGVNGGSPMKGQFAEVLIYSRVLSTAERSAVENYLHNKWAL